MFEPLPGDVAAADSPPEPGVATGWVESMLPPMRSLADVPVGALPMHDRLVFLRGLGRAAGDGRVGHLRGRRVGGPLGRRHHRTRTHGRWQVQATGPHTLRWTSPHGLTTTTDDRDGT